MSIQVEKEEQYVLIRPEIKVLEEKEVEQIEDKFMLHIENKPRNFILNLSAVERAGDIFYAVLDKLNGMLEKDNGSLVIAEPSDLIAAKLAEYPFVIVPSQDEAVDFIFMEELEKQLRIDEPNDPLWE